MLFISRVVAGSFQRLADGDELTATGVLEIHAGSAGLSSWGALCQTQTGGPCPISLRSSYPCRTHNSAASRLKWGLVPIDIMMTNALILAAV